MTRLAWIMMVTIVLGTLLALAAAPASAAQYTNVAGMDQWSAETNYMSLPGYLRWMTFKDQGVWLSMAEAKRIVSEQMQER